MEVPSVLTRWPKYPELSAHNLRDARLYADRADMISALPVRRGGKVAEIGVWRGAFSQVLLSRLEPRQFFAFDIFTGHVYENWNGMTGQQLFDGLTQRQYYEREIAPIHQCHHRRRRSQPGDAEGPHRPIIRPGLRRWRPRV